jgi:CHAT domain-containing protein/outer membrane protein assembly factor BamD (BamD/ComL family)
MKDLLITCRIVLIVTLTVLCNFNILKAQGQDYSYRDHPLLLKGDSLINNDKWDEAIKTFFEADKYFKSKEIISAQIYAKGKMAFCYMQNDDYVTAFSNLSRALLIFNKHLESDISEICTIYSYLGSYYFNRPDASIDSSLIAYNKAIEICEKKLPEINDDLAMSYAGLASYYRRRDEYLESINYYKKAFEIRQKILSPNDQKLGYTCQSLGIAYRGAGETFRSQDYLIKAIDIYESNDHFSPSFEYTAYNGLANTYFDHKEFSKALPIYEKAIEIGSHSRNPQTLIVPLNNLASTYAHTNNPDTAEIIYRRALNINLNSKRIRQFGLMATYMQMGDYYLLYDNIDSARYCFEKSIEVVENMAFPGPIARGATYAWLARTETKAGNLEKALNLIQDAIMVLEHSFQDEDLYSNPDLSKTFNNDFLYEYLEVKADIFFLRYQDTRNLEDLEESQKLYLMVDSLTNEIRNGPYSSRTKLLVSRSFKRTAGSAIRNSQILHDLTKDDKFISMAFSFMEKNRYAELYSNVAKLKTLENEGTLDSVYNKEQELIYEIVSRRRKLSLDQEDSMKTSLSAELFGFLIEFEELQANLTNDLPSYQQVNYNSLLSLEDVEERLEASSQIFEYFIGDSLINIITITQSGSNLYSIPLTSELNNEILHLQTLISSFDSNRNLDELYNEYSQLSFKIYNQLIGDYLNEKTEEIIISLDGFLTQLPFEAFVVRLGKSSFRNEDYLLSEYDISYVFSINLTFTNPAPDFLKRPTFVGFAYSGGLRESSIDSRKTIAEIPYSAEEVNAIKNSFNRNVKILIGSEATETSFKNLAGDYNILHLAVHGDGDTLDANNSRLIFRMDSLTNDDGILYAHELYNLPFNNLRMAVLSACESGIGKEYPGEGIFSMARGFTYAGCPTTIMSLWTTNDATTAQIMELFYEYLDDGFSTSQALRSAKLEYIRSSKAGFAHPEYWAALVPMGDSKPIVKPQNKLLKYTLWVIPWLLIAIAWYITMQKRRANARKT